MRLEVEGKKPVDGPTEAQVRAAIMGLRSYGPASFASLTDEGGSYLQVAGGGVGCLLEHRDAVSGRHFRAYHDAPSKVFPDGTVLVFSGGKMPLKADEWFAARVVVETFLAFLAGSPLPESIRWRDVTESLRALD